MKMQTRLLAVGLVLICVPMFAHAEVNLPKLSGAVVRSVVSREENPPDAFRYDYRVDNSGGTLPLMFMAIDIQTDPSRIVVSAEGLDDTAGSREPSSAMFRAELGPQGLLGIALPINPQGWVVSIIPDATAGWGVHDPAQRIQPGTSKEGFVLLSRALPGIRSVTLEAELWGALVQHDDESPEVLVEALDDAALRVLTVGPVALPEGSTPGSLAVGIDSLREQARTQGWIANDAISTSLASLLSTLSAAINDGRFSDAKGAARDFLQLVESNSCTTLDCTGKPLTSEAYALMRFNMEHLLAQLPNSAQVPDIPDLDGVVTRAVITEEADALRFEYRLDNTAGTLPVDGFVIPLISDASRSVVGIDGLDNSADTFFSSASYRAEFAPESYVSVAFPAQSAWGPSFDANRNVNWGALGESRVLAVGGVQTNLSLITRALPGIRTARLSADVLDLLPTESELDADDLVPADLQVEVEASEQVSSVVAPVAPPATLDLVSFADEIEALRVAARAEGWFTTDDAATSLGATLSALRDALSTGQNEMAKDLATQFLTEVDATSCTTYSCSGDLPLSSEAFALMHFNMVFLRSNIPNSAPTCDAAATKQPSPIVP